MNPSLDRNEWDDLLRAKIQLEPGVKLHVEETIRQGEVAPAGLAYDSTTGRTYSLAPWHCHFMRMLEGGIDPGETIRVVVGFFPNVASRERIQEFVAWLETKNLATVERSDLRTQRTLARKRALQASPGTGTVAPAVSVDSLIKPGRVGNALQRVAGRANAGKSFPKTFGMAAIATIFLGFLAGNFFRVSEAEALAVTEKVLEKEVAPKMAEAIPIRAAAPGILTEVLVRNGDQIDKGDVVARMQNAEALKSLEELRRDLGEHRMKRDEYYRTENWDAYITLVRKIVDISQRIGEQEAASRPVDLRSPVAGMVEADTGIGRNVGVEIPGGALIIKVRADKESNTVPEGKGAETGESLIAGSAR